MEQQTTIKKKSDKKKKKSQSEQEEPPSFQRKPVGPPEISPSEIQKNYVLGDGSFGVVYAGKCRSKDVAIKVLYNQQLDSNTLFAFRKEVEIMSQIYHPNIVLFMGACTIGELMIVTELMPKGDLETLLRDRDTILSLVSRMTMAKEAALGMTWLHGANPSIIHRDLKTSNLLIDENFRIKICDFGLSQVKQRDVVFLKDGVDGAKGTPLWMAPEVLTGQNFDEKADVYSFGIVLWELLTRSQPFQEFSSYEDFRKAVCIDHVRPLIPDDCPTSLKKLISNCWDPKPANRIKFPEIVEILDNVVVDAAIYDQLGREFWKTNFLGQTSIPWDDFQIILDDFFKQIDPTFHSDTLPDDWIASPEKLMNASISQLTQYGEKSPESAYIVMQEMNRRNHPVFLQQKTNEKVESDVEYNSELAYNCLKAVLAEVPKAQEGFSSRAQDFRVSLEKFGKILAWFGPILHSTTRKVILLENVFNLLRKKWFHGDLGTPQAEARLASEKVGAYLIRFSSTNPGWYTISKKGTNGTSHQRIIHKPGGPGYYLNNKRYDSLDSIIELASKELQLEYPCSGNPFLRLFDNQELQGYILVNN